VEVEVVAHKHWVTVEIEVELKGKVELTFGSTE
jgi:hypothetical protein